LSTENIWPDLGSKLGQCSGSWLDLWSLIS
jgi:hypothetical protein